MVGFSRPLRIEPLEDRRLLAVVTVDTLADTIDFNDGVISLREAIFATNIVPGADTIEFASSLTSGGSATLALTQGELAITDALEIHGPGAGLLTIDAVLPSRIFNITAATGDFTIAGLTLTGGRTTGSDISDSGGAIRSVTVGVLTIRESVITGNRVEGVGAIGGGVFNYGGDLVIVGTTVSGNTTVVGRGGGVGSYFGSVTVRNSQIADNTAHFQGGGIYARGPVEITGSTISGNTAESSSGGGVFSSYITVAGSTISGNTAGGTGGGIGGYGDANVTGSTIQSNTSRYGGGGIFAAHLLLDATNVRENATHNGYGGGVWAYTGSVIGSTVAYNSTNESSGGGIGGSSLTIVGSTIHNNSAKRRGGGVVASSLTVSASTIHNNTAEERGGGIDTDGLELTDSTISGNSSHGEGGGVVVTYRGAVKTISNSTISGNTAVGNGGGVYWYGHRTAGLAIRHSTISGNAAHFGGGIFAVATGLSLENTIVAGNSAVVGADLTGLIGLVLETRFNLIGDGQGSGLAEAPVAAPDADGNLVGGVVHGLIDPLLGPLADNGGPTPTHALLPGSPAIDAGDPAAVAGVGGVPEFDQRGAPFGRVSAQRIDIGAYESPPAEIHGLKWSDLDGDGLWDRLAEPGVAGWTFYLDSNLNGVLDVGETWTTTGPDGGYAFTDLAPGEYTVAEVLQPGWTQTVPGGIVTTELIANGGFETGDFTGWIVENSGSGDFVINDGSFDPLSPDGPLPPYEGSFSALTNQGGQGTHAIYQDAAIPAGSHLTLHWADRIRNHAQQFQDPNQEYRVEIRNTANQLLATVFSTNAGDPLFQEWTQRSADLSPFAGQTVRIAFVEQDNLTFFNLHVDDVRITGGGGASTIRVTLAAGQVVDGIDFGNVPPGEIRGVKWNDLDGDGVWDRPEEPGLEGWTIYLDSNFNGVLDDGETSTTTGPDGGYSFTSLVAGDYLVAEVMQPGWVQTFPGHPDVAGPERLFAVRGIGTNLTIYELDPTDGSVIHSFAAPAAVGTSGPQGLALGPGSLFYVNGSGPTPHTLWELNPDTGEVIDSDVVDATSPGTIAGLAYLDGRVYLEKYTTNQILVWDPVSDTAVTTLNVSADLIGGLTGAADLGVLFDSNIAGNVFRIDPATGAVLATLFPGVGPLNGGLAYINGELIAANNSGPAMAHRIDPSTGAVLGSFALGGTGNVSGLGGDGTPSAVPIPVTSELIVNGGFETGDFTGWTVNAPLNPFAPWTVSSTGGQGSFGPISPIEGTYDAWNGFDGGGPIEFTMYQDVSIPAASLATLSWQDYARWNVNGQPRTVDVQVRDPITNAVLDTVYSFSTTGTSGNTGWQLHSVDLSSYAGSNVRIYFVENIPQTFTGPGQIEFDAISLMASAASGLHFVTLAAGQVVDHINFGNLSPGEIHGAKWNDLDGDGVWDRPEEPGLEGWTIYLDSNLNGLLDAGEPSTTTGRDGGYAFTGLAPGLHLVGEVGQEGWAQTHAPSPVTLDEGEQALNVDFGNIALPALLGDYNQNGVVDMADFTVWRDMLGRSGLVPYSGADGSGNGSVGPEDYEVWKAHYGQSLPAAVGGAGVAAVSTAEQDGSGTQAAEFATHSTAPLQGDSANSGIEVAYGWPSQFLAPTIDRQTVYAIVGADAAPAEQPAALPGGGVAKSLSANRLSRDLSPAPNPSRPARGVLRTLHANVARRDDALVAWLASRFDAESRRDRDRDSAPVADQSADRAANSRFDAVDEAFESLLAPSV